MKSKKEIEGLNKVAKKIMRKKMAMKVIQEMQAKKEAEMVQKIIEKVRMSQKSILVDKIMKVRKKDLQ